MNPFQSLLILLSLIAGSGIASFLKKNCNRE